MDASRRSGLKKIIYIAIGAIATTVFFSMSFAAYSAKDAIAQEVYLSSESTPQPTPIVTKKPTPKPSPTIRAAFIPDPDELQALPIIAEIEVSENMLESELDEETLHVSWSIIANADYYVFCAMNDEEIIYHRDILWPDISEWLLPEPINGNIYLFCYENMGEDSAEDDNLIAAFVLPVQIEEETPVATLKPTTKEDDDEAESEIQNKYLIIVDKSDFTFGVFTYDDDGEYTILVEAFPTAIGRSDRMTPNGTFAISSKGAWKAWSSGSYSPYYTRFTSGLYFHGAVYSAKRGGAMYKSYYNGIGTATSSGCLRTTWEAAKWVYYNCPAGTVVKIVNSSDMVTKVIKPPLDPAYPKWDPTDPDKPSLSPPLVITNTILTLDEGESASLKDLLASVDISIDDASVIYEIITPPTNGNLSKETFTQAQIDADSIIYTHDGTETIADSFRFIVTNLSSTTGTITFSIRINLVDDTMPVIELNEWITIDQGASKSLSGALLASDDETESDNLIYTITQMPQHGSIPYSFTQGELLSGEIIYIHDGTDALTDSFMFSVSDGVNVLEGQMFSISVNVTEQQISSEPTPEAIPETTPDATP